MTQPSDVELRSVHWGPRGRPDILSDITMFLPTGQVLAICGANGAGKSSLLRLIYRFHAPRQGKVMLAERDIWQMRPAEVARMVATVLQEQPTDFARPPRQIASLGRLPHRQGWGSGPGKRDVEILKQALARRDLTAMAERPCGTLSGGERQRVMVARALVEEPRVILLDGPTNHLDIRHQLGLLRLLRGLGLTVIATLHDLRLAAQFADRVIVLHDDHTLCDGPPAEALTEGHLATAFDIRAEVDRAGPAPRFAFHLNP